MNKIKKISLIFVITFIIINIFIVNNCYGAPVTEGAEGTAGGTSSTTKKEDTSSTKGTINPDDYDPSKQPLTERDAAEVVEKVGVILGAIRSISVVVSVIILMVIGFKYIIGSVEEKANYKATMIPYIIGCIMAIAGTTIVSTIYDALN